ncbi:MAG: hypothetical protein ISS16_03005 [Ignavibacteria bacterium]|nr:hypothetical protein [Ignavibacteria bacterium]
MEKIDGLRFKDNWKKFWAEPLFKIQSILTIVLLVLTLLFFSRLLIYIEQRPGVILDDPILNLFNAIELNWIIFPLIYLSILSGIIHLTKYPAQLIILLQSYILMDLFRMLSMYVTPLEPPLNTIDLKDPLVFVLGTGTIITKDLFFSGHTSTMLLLSLSAVNKKIKIIFLINTFLVALLMLIQKAHYSIDLIAAPFYAYCSYKIICVLQKKLKEKYLS